MCLITNLRSKCVAQPTRNLRVGNWVEFATQEQTSKVPFYLSRPRENVEVAGGSFQSRRIVELSCRSLLGQLLRERTHFEGADLNLMSDLVRGNRSQFAGAIGWSLSYYGALLVGTLACGYCGEIEEHALVKPQMTPALTPAGSPP